MKAIACTPGVVCAKFHQCMYGLLSKMDCIAVLKLTQLMTNIPEIVCEFKDVRCKRPPPDPPHHSGHGRW